MPPSEKTIESHYSEGDTILSRARDIYRKKKDAPFIYDAIVGEMTRDGFFLKSYVIGEYLKKYRHDRIGIMLPALASTSLLVCGSYLAGKLPVMLNWTV